MLPITKNIFAYESTQTGIARFNIWKKCCDYTHLWDMQLTRYCRQGVADKDVLLTRIGFLAERWGAFCIIGSLEDQYRLAFSRWWRRRCIPVGRTDNIRSTKLHLSQGKELLERFRRPGWSLNVLIDQCLNPRIRLNRICARLVL